MNNNTVVYSNRVVAFIDILGFKNLVSNPTNQNKIFSLMQYLKSEKNRNYKTEYSLSDLGREITIFSDSIVISYDLSFKGQIFYILLDIIHFQLDIANMGILLRGGVSIGSLYHNKEIVFGPAMINAYNLESKNAIYPRIILDSEIFNFVSYNPSLHYTPAEELEYILSLLKQDFDGFYFTDFLNQYTELDKPENIFILINKLKNIIHNYLHNVKSPLEVKQKYIWLDGYIKSLKFCNTL
ncbi:hypothetical protein EXD82_07910 [Peptacetobacter hominis]|uniref:Guanylate cyclase domain-containing protein n=1 Tax=Peptacetobacter hominis TaxID=2743610 RepID=A0A544QU71_9FIRM|nr:hypothetical protein [Peptacetobacter hominis]TQQ84249.1 hypothetical protein EXD82_07910 [Peptacetobacter hominis]